MTLLQSMEGKYYDVPEEQATSFEVPREKVRELLSKAGPPPSAQGAPGAGPRQGGPSGPPPGAGGGSPVIIQVLPNGVHGPAQHGGPPPGANGDGDVDPYWFYYYWWRNWSNYWY